jgi:predicted membrane-bound spermidine synthase
MKQKSVSRGQLLVVVFTSGFVLMVFEIVGSRILAPFLGSSTIVWTAIIGVILSFMSLGYWYGGKLADKHHSIQFLARVLALVAALFLIMNLGKGVFLSFVTSLSIPLVIKAILSSTVLFSIPSFLLAFVSPVAIRLDVRKVEESGNSAGSIYAVSTLGSILGTFFSGFFLIIWFGTNQLIWVLALVLMSLVLFISKKEMMKQGVWLGLLLIMNLYNSWRNRDYIDIDTEYARVFVSDQEYKGQETRLLYINEHINSGMLLNDSDSLLFRYTQFYDLFEFFAPEFENLLVVGGGGYSYPRHFQSRFPDKALDVVELDPKVTQLAMTYFEFEPLKTTTIYHQDARYFQKVQDKKYDAIVYDALTSPLSVPWYLTTQESYEDIYNLLSDDGVILINVIGDLEGYGANFVRSQVKTVGSVFPQVFLFESKEEESQGLKNHIVVASKKTEPFNFDPGSPFYQRYLKHQIDPGSLEEALVLRDDYAPVSYLLSTK